jgi:hypothetical protein
MAEFPEDDDDKERREEALGGRLGVQQWYYLQAIQAAVAFTSAAPADPNPRQWRQWGARNLGGRIRSLAQDPRNPSTIYAGSAQGGVFRSDDGGDTWRSLGLPGDSFPVGALALAPSDSTVLYVGTGEPAIIHDPVPPRCPSVDCRPRGAAAGLGLFRCDTSTGTFTNESARRFRRPVRSAPPTVTRRLPSIRTSPTGAGSRVIRGSGDGNRWRRASGAADSSTSPPPVAPALGACVSDVVAGRAWDQNQPTTYRLFAAVAGIGIFRGVFTPARRRDGVGSDPHRRLACRRVAGGRLRPHPPRRLQAYPNHVYAVLGNRADHSILSIFHSVDGGTNWAARAVPEPRQPVVVGPLHRGAPEQPRRGDRRNVNVARSLDFGANWDTIIDWVNHTAVDRAQHGDHHALLFDVREPNSLWIGNDGGISFTADVVNANPLTASTWRKRSHGLCVSQFNDITVHPDYPFMMGGGLQDNATYLTYGGPTWAIAGGGDGGQMCFEVRDPRNYIAPNQPDNGPPPNHNNLVMSSIVSASTAGAGVVRSSIADVAVPNDVVAMESVRSGWRADRRAAQRAARTLRPERAASPADPQNLMAGRFGDIVFSTNAGLSYTAGGAAAAVGGFPVQALAYGPGATAAISDWWIGTGNGVIVRETAAPSRRCGPTSLRRWPPGLARISVTAVAVHPNNNNYVVACTGGNAAAVAPIVQGACSVQRSRRPLDGDHGLAAAFDLSGRRPEAGAGPLNPLPPVRPPAWRSIPRSPRRVRRCCTWGRSPVSTSFAICRRCRPVHRRRSRHPRRSIPTGGRSTARPPRRCR